MKMLDAKELFDKKDSVERNKGGQIRLLKKKDGRIQMVKRGMDGKIRLLKKDMSGKVRLLKRDIDRRILLQH